MKKIVLLLAASASTFSAAEAQTTIGKGAGLLTGSVGYHTDTEDVSGGTSSGSTVTYGTFKLDLAIGGFVADNLALGVQLSHTVTGGSIQSTYQSSGPPTTSALRVGPMMQYYKMLGEQFGLTAMLGGGYESDSRVVTQHNPILGYPSYNAKLKATGFYTALMPGIVFFPVPKFGLTATMGSLAYNRLTIKNDAQTGSNTSSETVSSFDAGFGISQLQFGAAYYFGRK